MKFVLAFFGTRGDVEPGFAIGRELLRRGHDVHMAVTPDLIPFAESAGLAGGALRTGQPGVARGDERLLEALLPATSGESGI